MSLSAALNIGNGVQTNITNSALNSNEFTSENITKVMNVIDLRNDAIAQSGNKAKVENKQKSEEVIGDVVVTGEGNTLTVEQVATVGNSAAVIQEAEGKAFLDSVTSVADSIVYQVATGQTSGQDAQSTADAMSSMSNECSADGLGAVALSCGIGNSTETGINNSISNVFKSSVSNIFVSETQRVMQNALASIAANAAAIQSDQATLQKIGNITVGGKGNTADLTQAVNLSNDASVKQLAKAESAIEAILEAEASIESTAMTEVSSQQAAKVDSKGSSLFSGGAATIGFAIGGGVLVIAAIVVVVILVMKKKRGQ